MAVGFRALGGLYYVSCRCQAAQAFALKFVASMYPVADLGRRHRKGVDSDQIVNSMTLDRYRNLHARNIR